MDDLILADFYSKRILVCNLPTGQSNSAKVIHILEELFCDHGTPEVLHTDTGPQYSNTVFANSALNRVSPKNLQPTVPTLQWICQVLCQDSQAYTAACQVQWYKSKDCTIAPEGHPS